MQATHYSLIRDNHGKRQALGLAVAGTASERQRVYEVLLAHHGSNETFHAGTAPALPDQVSQAKWVVVTCGADRPIAAAWITADPQRCPRNRFLLEQQFDLSELHERDRHLLEIAGLCVHPDFRNGHALSLLWHGIGRMMAFHDSDCLIASLPIPLSQGDCYIRSLMDQVLRDHRLSDTTKIRAKIPLPRLEITDTQQVRLPSLLKAALHAGARVGDQPYWDAARNTINLSLLLDRHRMPRRYLRRYVTPL